MTTINTVKDLMSVPSGIWLVPISDQNGVVSAAYLKARAQKYVIDEGRDDEYARRIGCLPAQTLHPRVVTEADAREYFRDFITSFNDDEAGNVDVVRDIAGNTGFVPAGGNDMWHVFLKALTALGFEVQG